MTNLWAAIIASLTAALTMLMQSIPRLLGFLVITVVGWLVAGMLATGVDALLRSMRFNTVAENSGFAGFVRNMGIKKDASAFLADVVKWFVQLITLVIAFDALGLPAVSTVLQQMLLWIPNLVVAVVILVVSGVAANALSNLVRGATAQAGFSNAETLATLTRVTVWGFAIVVAANQVGIASTLVNTLFMGFVGALALGSGLAFGLGGKETAARIVNDWYNRSREAGPKLERAAENLGRAAQGQGPGEATRTPMTAYRQ